MDAMAGVMMSNQHSRVPEKKKERKKEFFCHVFMQFMYVCINVLLKLSVRMYFLQISDVHVCMYVCMYNVYRSFLQMKHCNIALLHQLGICHNNVTADKYVCMYVCIFEIYLVVVSEMVGR